MLMRQRDLFPCGRAQYAREADIILVRQRRMYDTLLRCGKWSGDKIRLVNGPLLKKTRHGASQRLEAEALITTYARGCRRRIHGLNRAANRVESMFVDAFFDQFRYRR